jgi:hypothetical protein
MSKLDNASDKVNRVGRILVKKATFPIILFVIGLMIFPLGIILWLIALGLIASKNPE